MGTQSSIYPKLRSIVAEFIKNYSQDNSDDWKSKALKIKYVYKETESGRVPLDKDIAKLLGVHPESVRQLIKSVPVDYCSELLRNGNAAFAVIHGIKHIEVKEILMDQFGFGNDEKTLRFFLDGMQYSITEQKGIGNYCLDTKLYGDNIKGILVDVIGEIKNLLKDNPVPRDLEDIMIDYKKLYPNVLHIGLARDYMLADTNMFEISHNGDNTYVAIRWERLSETNRIVRILFDFGIKNGFDIFMSKEQIIREYNTRAYVDSSIKKLAANRAIKKDKHIQFGGNGTYRYKGDGVKSVAIDLKSELLKYIANNQGCATFKELRDFVDINQWQYSDVTIKAYLADDCMAARRIGGGKTTYYVLNSCWPDYQKQGYKIARNDRGNGKHCSSKGTRRMPDYKIAIINKAIALLNAAEGHKLRTKVIYDSVLELYPGKSPNNIYSIINACPLIGKTGTGKGAFYFLMSAETES